MPRKSKTATWTSQAPRTKRAKQPTRPQGGFLPEQVWYGASDLEGNDEWKICVEGTLEDVLLALTNSISKEVDDFIWGTARHLDYEPEEWENIQQNRRYQIRRQCIASGRCDGCGWHIWHQALEEIGLGRPAACK